MLIHASDIRSESLTDHLGATVLLFSVLGCVCLLLNSHDVQAFLGIHVSSFGNFTAQWYTTTGTRTLSR